MADPLPSVSVVVPTFDGRAHLGPCLESLARQDYPRERLRVVVVDNGSTDGSVEFVHAVAPDAVVVEFGANRGFAIACNEGARATDADLVAFLNNDMVADEDWLSELVRTWRSDASIRCVAGCILDATGERIDFVDAARNFHGFGNQPQFGAPRGSAVVPDHDLPFACGGSMLVERERFVELGGFDEGSFAYFEDVDLGWRMNLAGDRIVLAPRALVRHRHHGTSSRMAPEQRVLLLERNALRSMVHNADELHLQRDLAAALALVLARAVDESGSVRERFDPFRPEVGSVPIPASAMARLHAVVDVLYELPELMRERRRVDGLRRGQTTEPAPVSGLVEPFGSTSAEYDALFRHLVASFGIGRPGDGSPGDGSPDSDEPGRRIDAPRARNGPSSLRVLARRLRRAVRVSRRGW